MRKMIAKSSLKSTKTNTDFFPNKENQLSKSQTQNPSIESNNLIL